MAQSRTLKENKETKPSQTKTPRAKSKKSSPLGAREKLILAGKKLFAQKGLSGTSIRDIAKAAQMNSSMISYYFEGKEGLYRECLREIGEKRLAFAQEILTPPSSEEDFKIRLGLLIDNLFSLFLEDRDTGLIVVREYDRIHSPAEEVFKKTFLRIFDLTIQFFQTAQENKIIVGERDPFILASLFFGALSSQMRLDHIKKKAYDRSLTNPKEKEKIKTHLIGLFL
ncbi:MAG: TetR/AcrR family transcriptional regulator [Bdellovibrionales bacterium]|nr:TetR/AcrR family transcriptional regulator [Bdellovibrionales bacterium]